METTALDTDALAAAYAESVELEREAWHALQSLDPGTPARAQAWNTWSSAIVRTNRAWRRLNANRIGHPAPAATNRHAAA